MVGQVPDEILTLAPCAKSEAGKRLDYALQCMEVILHMVKNMVGRLYRVERISPC